MTFGTRVRRGQARIVRSGGGVMTTNDILLAAHVGAGGTALASFWIPMVAAKGGRVHRAAGRVFVIGMAIVSVTAVVLSALRLADPATPARLRMGALFLGYLGIVTAEGTYKAIRVLRTKGRTGRTTQPLDLVMAGLVFVGGIATAILGLRGSSGLVTAFGVVGVIGGWASLRYWWRPPQEPMHWWYEHMGATGGTSIAAITAFLVLNASRVCGGPWMLLAWLAPSLVGVPLLILAQVYYRRRFTPTPRPA
jgi:uncharacterized membrane protein